MKNYVQIVRFFEILIPFGKKKRTKMTRNLTFTWIEYRNLNFPFFFFKFTYQTLTLLQIRSCLSSFTSGICLFSESHIPIGWSGLLFQFFVVFFVIVEIVVVVVVVCCLLMMLPSFKFLLLNFFILIFDSIGNQCWESLKTTCRNEKRSNVNLFVEKDHLSMS